MSARVKFTRRFDVGAATVAPADPVCNTKRRHAEDQPAVKRLAVKENVVEQECPLSVKMLTGKTVALRLLLSDTVSQLKEHIQRREGIPPDQQSLVFKGTRLEDDRTLESYDIRRDPTLHLVLRMRGGMFHMTSGTGGIAVRVTCALGTVTLRFAAEGGTMAELHAVFLASRPLFLSQARAQLGDELADELDAAFDWKAPYNHAHWVIDESLWNYGTKTLQQLGVVDGSELAYGQ